MLPNPERDGWMENEGKGRRREEEGWKDSAEVMKEGVNASAVSQSVNGLEKRPTQKELMCVALFKAGVFVCVRW